MHVASSSELAAGSDAGFTIGGAGGGQGHGEGGEGSGGGCGAKGYHTFLVLSHVQEAFMAHEKHDTRHFHAKAELWFDSKGRVSRASLVSPTGDRDLDTTIVGVLEGIDTKTPALDCNSPFLVTVSEPSSGLRTPSEGVESATWRMSH
jgi:hypothetical protein